MMEAAHTTQMLWVRAMARQHTTAILMLSDTIFRRDTLSASGTMKTRLLFIEPSFVKVVSYPFIS